MTTPVQPDQLRISTEMGDECEPSDRLVAALEQVDPDLACGPRPAVVQDRAVVVDVVARDRVLGRVVGDHHPGAVVVGMEEASARFALPPAFLAIELHRRRAVGAPQSLIDGAEQSFLL